MACEGDGLQVNITKHVLQWVNSEYDRFKDGQISHMAGAWFGFA